MVHKCLKISRKMALGSCWWTSVEGEMVAREGIEPPTRGFSVRCSTN
jgi:hypothetical protein